MHYFRVSKKFGEEGGEYQGFPSKNFCLTVPKISVGESFTVALVFLEGGVSNFYVENFLSHGAEKCRRGRLHCCINFWNRKCLEKGGGVYQKFPSKILCLTVPTKIAVGESFIVALLSGIERFGGEGGRYQDFPSTIFCLTVPTKNSVGESFIVVLISGIEKVWSRGGGGEGWEYQVFPLKIFCLTVPKISVGESFSVALIFGEEGGGIKSLRRNVFVSQCRKFP